LRQFHNGIKEILIANLDNPYTLEDDLNIYLCSYSWAGDSFDIEDASQDIIRFLILLRTSLTRSKEAYLLKPMEEMLLLIQRAVSEEDKLVIEERLVELDQYFEQEDATSVASMALFLVPLFLFVEIQNLPADTIQTLIMQISCLTRSEFDKTS
jgi:hypothetical protein